MSAATEVADIVKGSGLSPDVQMTIFITLIVLMLAAPIGYWLFSGNKRRVADGQIAASEGGLYQHLAEQVAVLTKRLDAVHTERNDLVVKVAKLSAEVERLATCEDTVGRLQLKLDGKDALIGLRDKQINELFSELRARNEKIEDLMEKVHRLEVRVSQDEREWNAGKDDGK